MGSSKSRPQKPQADAEFERYVAAVQESSNLQRIYVIKEAARQFLEKFQVSPEKLSLFEGLVRLKEKELANYR